MGSHWRIARRRSLDGPTRPASVGQQLGVVLLEHLWRHPQAEVDPEQELALEGVELGREDSAHPGVVRVVVVRVVGELGGQEDGRDDDPVGAAVREEEAVAPDEPVDVDEAEDEALLGAGGVLVDADDGDGRAVRTRSCNVRGACASRWHLTQKSSGGWD